MFKCLFKRAWHTFVLSMFAPLVLGFQPFCWKEHKRGCLLFFSDIRTKEQKFIECSNVCSSELDILLSFQRLHLWCWVFNSFCFKNVVLCTYKLVCMMNVWQKWHELVHVRAVGYSSLCILMFFCSCVFIILYFVLSLALCCRWD